MPTAKEGEAGEGVPPQAKSSWSSFLKSIASFNGDLSSMTAPPFILGTTSLTEFSAYWTEQPSIFVAPASEPDPAKRAMLVLKWFLSTLKHSYSARNDKYGSEKKPLNPFLGELFLGKWDDKAGTTHLVSEQVSHHPPVTAYCIWNDQHGIQLQGYNAQKASFSRTIHVKQIGHAIVSIPKYNETHLITLPALHIEGLIYGKPFVELNGSTYITSSSGFISKIDYSGKGWLSGKKNTFTATLAPLGREKDVLYTIEGQWNDSFSIHSGSSASKKLTETFNAKTEPTSALIVPPLDKQDPYESNRAWQHVAKAIRAGDMETVGREKSKIENAQRELRKKEAAEGREWQRRFFKRSPDGTNDDTFTALSKGMPGNVAIEAEKTGGIWRFDESLKAKQEDKDRSMKDGKPHAEIGGVVMDQAGAPPSISPQTSRT